MWRCNTGAARTKTGRLVRFNMKGTADFVGCALGRFFAIEAKSATGTQSDDQRAFMRAVRAAGGVYVVARDIATVDAMFNNLGIYR